MSQTCVLGFKPWQLGLAGFSLLTAGLSEYSLQAQPIVPASDGTGTVVVPNGDRLDILGGRRSGDGANLFHSFQQFGLSADQIANFLATPALQNILGRVVGGDPSIVNGLIQLSGGQANLYLINPAGIVFGPNAHLNVPSDFFATTATGIGFSNGAWLEALGSNDYHNLVGTPTQFAFDGLTAGALVNAGQLSVNPGQHLALIGGQIANTGEIATPGGQITISAVPGSRRVRLSQSGHLLSLEIEPPRALDGAVLPIVPPDLPALLTNSGLNTGAIAHPENTIEFSTTGHQVPLSAATAAIAGRLDASHAAGTGGEVAVLGDRIALLAAEIDASGSTGGGSIRVGGEYRGQNGLPTAHRTTVSRDTQLRADAREAGDGGRVILWADAVMGFFGEISARGGLSGGDGGFVEVSGQESLAFNGRVDASAPSGADGNILLDPRNIIIGNIGSYDNQLHDNQILASDGNPAETFRISVATLAALSGTVTLEATNQIRFDEAVTFPNYIHLIANSHNIDINAPITFANAASQFSATATDNIDIRADISGAATLDFDAADYINVFNTATVGAETIDFYAQTQQVDVEGRLHATAIHLASDNLVDIDAGGVVSGTHVTLSSPNHILLNNGAVLDSENVTFRTDNIQIWNGSSFNSNGSLTIEPMTPSPSANLADILNHVGLDSGEFNRLLAGFDAVTVDGIVAKAPPIPIVPAVEPPPPAVEPAPVEPAPTAVDVGEPPPAPVVLRPILESGGSVAASGDRPLQIAHTRALVEQALDSGDPSAALQALDGHFSQAFAQQLGRSAAAVSVPEFQRRLQQMAVRTGTQPAVIFAFLRTEQLDLILVPTVGAPRQYRVPAATAARVRARVRELHQEIVDPTRRHTTSYLPAAQQLDAWIVQPLRADLQRLGIDTLLFSLDEGLRSLPLAVLHDGEQFLIERYRFSAIPSLALANLNYTDVREASVLAMGISEFEHLNPLPAVPAELAAIAQQATNRKIVLNRGFTLENLQKQRQQAQASVVHLATHAEFMPEDQGGAFIQFWQQPLALTAMMAVDWQNPALALLVLSACRTALGDPSAEYGFAGLAVQSGVDTAIASLWYANDVGTLGLMSEFYHQLGRTPLKSEALRQAQLALLRGELRIEDGQVAGDFGRVALPAAFEGIAVEAFSHPYYWSGFTAIGNPW